MRRKGRFDKTGLTGKKGPGGDGLGGITFSSSDRVRDPRVIYDPTSQRSFASQVDFDGSARDPSLKADYHLFAVSDTDNPRGSWHVFSFLTAPGVNRFADFPTFGVDAGAVYLAGDRYHGMTNSLGTSLTMIPKTDLQANPPFITNREFFQTTADAKHGAILQPITCLDGSRAGNILAAGSLGDDFLFHSNLVATTMLDPGTTTATLSPGTNILVDAYTAPLDPTQPDGVATGDCGSGYERGGFLAGFGHRLSTSVNCQSGVPRLVERSANPAR